MDQESGRQMGAVWGFGRGSGRGDGVDSKVLGWMTVVVQVWCAVSKFWFCQSRSASSLRSKYVLHPRSGLSHTWLTKDTP